MGRIKIDLYSFIPTHALTRLESDTQTLVTTPNTKTVIAGLHPDQIFGANSKLD